MTYPVHDVTEPACLRGQQNGRLPDAILVSTPGIAGGPTVRLVEPAARSWRAMSAHALADGHELKATSLLDSYRPYETQVAIWQKRYTTSPLAGRPTKRWNGQTWYQRPGTAEAAVPGNSNHGRAIAVDTGTESDGDAGTESIDAETLAWLRENADEYGWSWELQSEPWHLRYFAGDTIPAAVLAFEAAGTSTEDDVDPICVPSWGKRQPNGRLPFYRLIRGGEQAAPYTAKVLAYPGAPLTGGLKPPLFTYGDSFGIPTLKMAGLAGKALAIEEGPGGIVVVVTEDGATFDVAKRP